MTPPNSPEETHLNRSSRDRAALPQALSQWLTPLVGADHPVEIAVSDASNSSGMSAETILFSGRWTAAGEPVQGRWVARVEPSRDDVPVFESYRLDHQFETIRLVGELTDVPVPRVRWLDATGEVLGMPSFVMDHVDGIVPPDNLPYTFGNNWFADLSVDHRRAMQNSTVGLIAKLHDIPNAHNTFGFLIEDAPPAPSALHRVLDWLKSWYRHCSEGVGRSPLAEQVMSWLDANIPAEAAELDTVLLWGDARMGNVLWRGGQPAAVLDWEMATLGPRPLDLAWGIFQHRVFQDLAEMAGLPGLPDVMRVEDVVAAYEAASGVAIGDLRWYLMLCAAQWCCIFMRTGFRRVHFGEIEMPADIETFFAHRGTVDKLLEGAL